MKKLLSTIGLGVALMTGFAPSQAEAYVLTLSNIVTGPNTWTYQVALSDGEWLSVGDKVSMTFGAPVTAVSNPTNPAGLTWSNTGPGTSVTWEVTNGMTNPSFDTNVYYFAVQSTAPNGTVSWATNTLGGGTVYSGTTSGPVPEPATIMLLGIGGLLAGGRKLYESRKDIVTA